VTSSTSIIDGRWRVGAVLGRGAVSDVFTGEDLRTGRHVAIKVLRSTDPVALRRFDREIDVLGRIDHPRIVRLLASGGDRAGCRYIVLEQAVGGSLAQRLASGPLVPTEVAQLAVDLGGGLAHAHAHGLVHRDVKPANVLLDGSGHAQLADFGIAQLVGAETLTATGTGIGTPAYIAPEQLRGDDVGAAADVYSLGLVLLEAATGRRAFPGEGVAAALARLDHRPVVPPEVPADLAALIRRMTAIDPAARPTAASISRSIDVPIDGPTMPIPVATIPTLTLPAMAEAPDRRRRWSAVVAVGVAAIALLAGAWRLSSGGGTPSTEPSPSTTRVIAESPTTTVLPTTPTTVAPVAPAATDGTGNGNGHVRPHGDGNGRHDRP
jgi:serine/threonine protein kinase